MKTEIIFFEKPKLDNPVLIEGLPGVGNVGRVAAGYLIEELKAVKFAELYSRHFLPFVMVHENASVHLLKNEFYYVKTQKKDQRDLIIVIGDSQSISTHGHYEIAWKMLDVAEQFGVKDIFTLGGFSTGLMTGAAPKVLGAVSDEELVKKYGKFGIEFNTATKVGTIVGASGLLIGLGRVRKMKGICLMGETAGFPIVTDPRAAESVLKVLTQILGVKISMAELDKRVKEMEKFIKKIEVLQRKVVEEMGGQQKEPRGDQLRYIG